MSGLRNPAEIALRTETIKFRTAVVVGVVAVIGAVVAILPAKQAASSAKTEANTSAAQVQTLTDENKQLRDQVSALQSASAPSITGSTSEPTRPVSDQPIYHEGDVTIAKGASSISLDSDPGDSTWSGDYVGLFVSNDNEVGGSATIKLLLVDPPASYDTCQSTGYAFGGYSFSELRGKALCAMTKQGRIATVTTLSVNSSKLSGRFHVVVYKGPDDN